MRKFTIGGLALALSLGIASTGHAQKFGAWGGQVYAGYPVSMPNLSNYANGSFTWGAGVNYSPKDAPWAIRFDVRNSRFSGDEAAIRKTLDSLGIDEPFNKDGYARTWDFSLAAELGTSKDNKFRAYALAGVGYGNKYSALTEPGVYSGCYWDPWWGYICGSGVGDVIVAKRNLWEFSWNAGGGISADVGRGARVFLEAIYSNIGGSTVTSGSTTKDLDPWKHVPIYLGVRF